MLGFGAISEFAINEIGQIDVNFNLENRSSSDERSIVEVASIVDCALIERLRQYPEELRVIDRRKFEQIIAELFSGFGYEVELTKRTRDGGEDIVAIKRHEVNVKYLIECKRPDPNNPVTVSTVRELLGVKVDDKATKAILATTTYLSSEAKVFVEKHEWELEARDYEGIKNWLDEYHKIKNTF